MGTALNFTPENPFRAAADKLHSLPLKDVYALYRDARKVQDFLADLSALHMESRPDVYAALECVLLESDWLVQACVDRAEEITPQDRVEAEERLYVLCEYSLLHREPKEAAQALVNSLEVAA